MRAKVGVVFLITFSLVLGLYLRSSSDFSGNDVVFLVLFVLGVLALEFALIWLTNAFVRSPAAVSLASAAAIIFNIYCLRAALIDDFAVLPVILQFAGLAGGIFVFYTLLSVMGEGRLQAKVGMALVGAFVLADVGPGFMAWYQPPTGGIAETTSKTKTASPNVDLVRFKRKPNVYIVAFDALMPRSLARKHLSYDGFSYHDILEKQFRTFPNMFADAVATKRSLNSILAFDPDFYRSLKAAGWTFFQGHTPSPLFQIFKSNGYVTNTVYRSRYFGLSKGPHVDNYYFLRRAFTLCEFIDDSTSVLTLFGYCRFVTSSAGQSLKVWLASHNPSQFEFLLDKIDQAKQANTPNIFVSYIYSPGHTSRNYRHTNMKMRKNYPKIHAESAAVTSDVLQKLKKIVDSQPGEAVLVVVGDHGPWLSRGVSAKDDPRFYVQDRFGIYGGIYPADTCEQEMERASKTGFTTINTVVRRLVECLSGGKDPFIRNVDYRIRRFSGKGLPDRYKEYVYE